jgi:hypothetical protein
MCGDVFQYCWWDCCSMRLWANCHACFMPQNFKSHMTYCPQSNKYLWKLQLLFQRLICVASCNFLLVCSLGFKIETVVLFHGSICSSVSCSVCRMNHGYSGLFFFTSSGYFSCPWCWILVIVSFSTCLFPRFVLFVERFYSPRSIFAISVYIYQKASLISFMLFCQCLEW